MSRLLAIVAVLLGLTGCATPATRPAAVAPQAEPSGFLDDYSSLRPGEPGDVLLVYRNPQADWRSYDKLLLEPVTLWRSGKNSLGPIPEADLLRLASEFESAVRRRIGESFPIVDQPGPGVLLVRLGITQARASDPILDVLTARSDALEPGARDDGPLSPEMQSFLDGAAIEGEVRDAQTGVLLAQGIDRRRSDAPKVATWAELERRFAFWADRVCSRLEARAGKGS